MNKVKEPQIEVLVKKKRGVKPIYGETTKIISVRCPESKESELRKIINDFLKEAKESYKTSN